MEQPKIFNPLTGKRMAKRTMADGRMLKKAISTSKKLAAVKTDSARLLYSWLLAHLDIEGRFSAEPDVVKGYVVPRLKSMTVTKIEKYLLDLAENKLILLYTANSDRYLELVKFKDFQTLREGREAASIIPEPTSPVATPVELPESSGLSKDKVSKDKVSKDKEVFDVFRKLYPGKKTGLEPVFQDSLFC